MRYYWWHRDNNARV